MSVEDFFSELDKEVGVKPQQLATPAAAPLPADKSQLQADRSAVFHEGSDPFALAEIDVRTEKPRSGVDTFFSELDEEFKAVSTMKQLRGTAAKSFRDAGAGVIGSQVVTFAKNPIRFMREAMNRDAYETVFGNLGSEEHYASLENEDRDIIVEQRKHQLKMAEEFRGGLSEEHRKYAEYAELAERSLAGQAVFDTVQNSPNLVAGVVGSVLDKLAPGAGAALSFGYMAAQEESGFMQMAKDLGISDEFAMEYGRRYGVSSGMIEYAQQILNVGKLMPGSKKVAKQLQKTATRKVVDFIADMGIEGLEEVAQGGLQFAIAGKMVRDWMEKGGTVPKEVRQRMIESGLALNEDGSINWSNKNTMKAFVRMLQAGGGVAAITGGLGISGRAAWNVATKGNLQDRFEQIYNQAQSVFGQDRTGVDAEVAQWAQLNPEAAKRLADIDVPSRKQWPKELPRVGTRERARIAERLRESHAAFGDTLGGETEQLRITEQKEQPAEQPAENQPETAPETPVSVPADKDLPTTIKALQEQAEALPEGDPRVDEIAAQIEAIEEAGVDNAETPGSNDVILKNEKTVISQQDEAAEIEAFKNREAEVDQILAREERGDKLTEDEHRLAGETDDLTRVKNKKGWRRTKKKEVIGAIDMNEFKKTNEEFGHIGADKLLNLMGIGLRKFFGYDNSGRPGGDEFAAQADTLEEYNERMNSLTEWAKSNTIEIEKADGTMGEGVLSFTHAAATGGLQDAEAAAKRADRAVFAKKQSRNGDQVERQGDEPGGVRTGVEDSGRADKAQRLAPEKTPTQKRQEVINKFVEKVAGAGSTSRQAVIKTLKGAKVSRTDDGGWNVIYKGDVIGSGKTNLEAWDDVASQLAVNRKKFSAKKKVSEEDKLVETINKKLDISLKTSKGTWSKEFSIPFDDNGNEYKNPPKAQILGVVDESHVRVRYMRPSDSKAQSVVVPVSRLEASTAAIERKAYSDAINALPKNQRDIVRQASKQFDDAVVKHFSRASDFAEIDSKPTAEMKGTAEQRHKQWARRKAAELLGEPDVDILNPVERAKLLPRLLEIIAEKDGNVWTDPSVNDDQDISFNVEKFERDSKPNSDDKFLGSGDDTMMSLADENGSEFAEVQLKEAFPGVTFTKIDTGWLGKLANGEEISIEVTSNIPVDIEHIMRTYDLTRAEAEERAAAGGAGATVSSGVKITLSDGTVITPENVMVLIDPRRANDTTAKHEALHVALRLGLFDTEEGQRLWNALIDEYGSEEGIAKAREAWTKPNGLWERIRDFFMRVMSKLGRGINAETALSETFSERFWSQLEVSEDRRGLAYQIAEGRTASVTSLKNAVIDDLRQLRDASELSSADPESWPEWLDAATDTIASDPQAGDALVAELLKKDRTISARESALLVMHHRRVYSEYERISDDQFSAHDNGDVVRAASLHTRVMMLVSQIDQIEEVARRVGTEAGRSLNVRKIMLNKDFSLAGLIRKARVAQGGEQLSADQVAELKQFADKVKSLEKRLSSEQAKSKGLKQELDKLHKEMVGNAQKTRLQTPSERKTAVRTKRKKLLVDLKGALASAGLDVSGFRESISKKTAPGISLQLAEGGESSGNKSPVDTPELRAVAREMASFFAENGTESFGEFWAQAKLHIGSEASKVESVFKDAWRELEAGPDFIGADISDASPKKLTRAARAIYERQLEAGMRDRDQIVDIVQDAMKEALPTREAAMEALSGYGQTVPLNEEKQMIRDHMAQLLQMVKINVLEQAKIRAEELAAEGKSEEEIVSILDKEELLLKATGFLRDDPSGVVRHLTAQVNQKKREMPVSAAARKGQLQSAREAAKRAILNRIDDLKWEIKHREPIVKKRSKMVPDERLIELRAERDALVQEHRKMFPPPGATEAQKDAAAEAGLNRAIALIEEQLETGDVEVKGPAKRRSNAAIDALRARLEALQAQRRVMQDKSGVTERRILKQREANLRKRIADQQEILASEDFAPKVKPEPYAPSNEELRLKKKLADVKKEVWQKLVEYQLAHMSPLGRSADLAKELAGLSRGIMTSIDESGFGRQGGLVTYSHPVLAKRAFIEMQKAFISTQSEFNTIEKIRNDPLWGFSEQCGLAVTDQDGSIESQDEAFRGRLLRKTKGVAGIVLSPVVASGRAYTTYLNYMRFYLFKQLVENLGRGGRVTRDEGKMIATFVNAASGRSDLKGFNKAATALNYVFFAARWVSSRFQYMMIPISPKFWKSSGRVKAAIGKEYARTLIGWGIFQAMLMAFGYLTADDDDEKPTVERDARSSDFLKPKFGDHRIDTTAGLSSAICVTSRILPSFLGGGKMKRADGTFKKFGEGYKPMTRATAIGKYLRYKMAPITGAVVTTLNDGINAVGKKETPLQTWGGLFVPLSSGEVSDAMTNQGLSRSAAFSILALLGYSMSVYGPTTEYLAADETERNEIFKGDLKKLQWDDPPVAYRKYLSQEQREKISLRRKWNAGMRVWQATATRPSKKELRDDKKRRAKTPEWQISDKDKMQRWSESRKKALDNLVGFPKADMMEAFDYYWKQSGRKKNDAYYEHLKELRRL